MISEEQKQSIYNLRKQNKSIAEISLELKLGKATIHDWCNKFDPEKKYNLTHKIKDSEKQEILEYFNKTNSLSKTCNNFKQYNRASIRLILLKQGVSFRQYKSKKEKSRQNVINLITWKKRKKKELVEYKGGKCEKCGYDKCIEALEFHHLDPKQKDFTIAGSSYSIERMKQEVDKCILICSNCHRELHYYEKERDSITN